MWLTSFSLNIQAISLKSFGTAIAASCRQTLFKWFYYSLFASPAEREVAAVNTRISWCHAALVACDGRVPGLSYPVSDLAVQPFQQMFSSFSFPS